MLFLILLTLLSESSCALTMSSDADRRFEELDNLVLSKKINNNLKESLLLRLLGLIHNIETKTIDLGIISGWLQGRKKDFFLVNPSIIKTETGYTIVTGAIPRYSPPEQPLFWRFRNYYMTYSREFKRLTQQVILKPKKVGFDKLRNLEDCRIFRWKDSYWFTCATNIVDGAYLPKQGLGRIDNGVDAYNRKNVTHLVRFNGLSARRPEKNWMHLVEGDDLRLIYAYDPFLVVRPSVDIIRPTMDRSYQKILEYPPPLDFSRFRGSASPIAFDNGYLMIVHTVILRDGIRNYIHRFLFLDKNLQVTKISRPFTFTKVGIEFATSMIVDQENQNLIIPVGIDDRGAKLCFVNIEYARKLLIDVGQIVGEAEKSHI